MSLVLIKGEVCWSALLIDLIWVAAPEEEWNMLLINGLTVGKGEISPEEFYAVIKKRIERTLIRTVRQLFGWMSSESFIWITSDLSDFVPSFLFLIVSISNFFRREDLTSSVFLLSIWKASNQERRRLSKYFRASHNGSCLEFGIVRYQYCTKCSISCESDNEEKNTGEIKEFCFLLDTMCQTTSPIWDSELCFQHLSIFLLKHYSCSTDHSFLDQYVYTICQIRLVDVH